MGQAPNVSILLFYPPSAVFDNDTLQHAIGITLASFPHLGGKLRLVQPSDKGRPYTLRYGRPWLEYGCPDDPGSLFEVDERACDMQELMPARISEGVTNAAPTNDPTLLPAIAPLLVPGYEGPTRPLSGVKLTRFSCGGTALAVSASHVLCDAGALGVFVRELTTTYRALIAGQEYRPQLQVLDAAKFDAQAGGDLDADLPDPELIEVESQLDVFRYDSWAEHPDAPPDAGPPAAVDAIDAARGRKRGTPSPWHLRSKDKALAYVIEFSPDDIERIHASVVGDSSIRVSVHDAFIAHLWGLVARARGQTHDEVLDCAMACDSRARLPESLSQDTPGCWNVCLGFQARACDILGPDGALFAAKRVRQALGTVRPDTVSAWLHKRAHDIDPNRERIAFAGIRTLCTTNWARCHFYGPDADFGSGGPIYAHNPVQGFGGYATILRQCGPTLADNWYTPGVMLALWLEEDAMGRLLADPALRGSA